MYENLTPFERQEIAIKYARDNLYHLAKELLEWKSTGLLNGGSGGQLRALAKIIQDDQYGLMRAERIVQDEALKKVVAYGQIKQANKY